MQRNNSDGFGALVKVASSQLQDLNQYIEQAPHRINMMCFGGGAGLVVAGALSMINIFNIFDRTIYYIVNGYQVFFGIVTCMTELHPEFAGVWHDKLLHWQAWMHEWAKGLTMLWGRGLFYLFQGMLCTMCCFNWYIGLVLGLYMMAMGAMCIQQHFKNRSSVQVTQDYIQIDGDSRPLG